MVDVRIENVYKYYGSMDGVAAVHDLTMDIKDGEFVAILGPSGCGKSSTMRMISGLEHISAGTISFGGNVVNDLAPKDRDIAMVFENYALYPHKTVFDNVANPLKLLHYKGNSLDSLRKPPPVQRLNSRGAKRGRDDVDDGAPPPAELRNSHRPGSPPWKI